MFIQCGHKLDTNLNIMILEILIVSFISLICVYLKPDKILILMALLLPIYGTIKTIVFGDSGDVFAFWKEIAIIILFIKTSRYSAQETIKYRNLFILYVIFVIYGLVMTAYSYSQHMAFLTNLKKILFPTFIFLSVTKLHLTKTQIGNILLSFAIGSILINITGLIDFFSPALRMVFRSMMKVGFVLDNKGQIYYDISSYTIMGINRVCGLMSGGPNQMGIYNSLVVFCLILYFMYFKSKQRIKSIFVYFMLILSTFCLLTSFSRAGWGVLCIALLLYALKSKQKAKVIYCIVFAMIIILISSLVDPKIEYVIAGTLSGKEASSATRGSMTQDAFRFVLNHPLGGGVGASDPSNFSKGFLYFAESSLLNIAIDIGVFGFLFLSVLYLKMYIYIKNNKQNMLNILGAFYLVANYITSLVSVNPYETPYIYLSWILLGLTACTIKKTN